MGFTEKTFYAVTCDYPGCTRVADDGEYTYWSDKSSALDQALDRYGDISADWYREDLNDGSRPARVFCNVHSKVWLADEEGATEETDDALVIDLPDGERVVLES